jgi:superfamily II DNA or RNA helicase
MRWFKGAGERVGASPLTAKTGNEGVEYGPDLEGVPVEWQTVEPILTQWEDDGFAIREGTRWRLTWDAVYGVLRSGLYGDITSAAGLPMFVDLAPQLVSRGSLTDQDFFIGITGWVNRDGHAVDRVALTGAAVRCGAQQGLLTEQVWRLVERIGSFAQRSAVDRSERAQRLAWGEIRRLALSANARLDDFLFRTVVVAPQRLRLGLRRGDESSGRLVEIIPDFDGRPDNWLQAFDTARSVQDRYDLSTPQGVVQVMLAPPVKAVLEQLKRMPGRRVAGSRAEAFLTNPFAALGESASEVINDAEFEAERVSAGLTFEHFTAYIESDAWGYPTSLGLLVETSTEAVWYRFDDDAKVEAFISKVRHHQSNGLQLCAWDEFEFELLGDTGDQLRILQDALALHRRPASAYLTPDMVFDLALYSERIQGIGEEKPYASPYIARKDEGQGWFPDNLVTLIGLPPETAGGEPRYVSLSPEQLEEVRACVRRALDQGESSVAVPGVPEPVPIDDVKNVVSALTRAREKAVNGELGRVNDLPRRRKTLLLKPNIASIDYIEKRREVLLETPTEPELPQALKPDARLKVHQLHGVAWLQHLFAQSPDHCRGAVLADDMGLGKTLQLLSLVAWVREQDPKPPPALIVAPVALLENWAEEVERFFREGALRILEVYGDKLAELRVPAAQLDAQLTSEGLTRFLRPGWIGSADIVLTTYETLRDHEFSFASEKWSVVVCDEAQKIKNPNALVSRAAKKQNARFRIACTGTPVENTLADLWCLFDFIQPGLLGALNDFGQLYRRPIEAETDEQLIRLAELREQIKPQILRRLKADVAQDLPPKQEDSGCKLLPLSPVQRTLYVQAVGQYALRNDPKAVTPFKNALGLLQYLRVVCTDPQPYGLTGFRAEPLSTYRSKAPKIDWLLRQLRRIQLLSEKVLIFCEFRDMQRLLRHYIQEELRYTAEIVNGDTAVSVRAQDSRQKRIQTFQQELGFGVIILSPLAVGFGLNIQAANHVIHYTRAWNPAKEDQATDRAHRIGQTKTVYVYCPVVTAEDFKTFDVKLDELLERKRTLAQDMLNGSGDTIPSDFDIGDVAPPDTNVGAAAPLTLDEVDRMSPRFFEALAAVLWARRGFSRVDLTPTTGDRGVDVVALDGSRGELVQCKHSGREGMQLGWEAIKDVVAGEAGYRMRYPGIQFAKACLTNQSFNATAWEQAAHNGVDLIDRKRLSEMLKPPVTLDDVNRVLYSER